MTDEAPSGRQERHSLLSRIRKFPRISSPPSMTPGTPIGPGRPYHCGTLTYTKAGLVALFAWLLWGDFCFTIMESVVPTVLPLKLKELAVPNWLMGTILSTIPGILNMTICPAVSFKSDRYRSKWGRRIPFIMWTLPFVCVSLVMLGCSEGISAYLQKHLPVLQSIAPTTVTVALIGIFMVAFQFFNMFVNSVYFYLFNDVVPAQFLSRFVGTFRIVGYSASALYQYFIFKYAGAHMREIFVGAAVLYAVGFTLMCAMVKEGDYPPVADEDMKKSRGFQGALTFMKECFGHKWYVLFFAWTSVPMIANAIKLFAVFFNLEMGLTLDEVGKLTAIGIAASVAAMYVASIYVDRWHPMRVQVYVGVFAAFTTFSSWVWIFVTLPGRYFFWLGMGTALLSAMFAALTAVCGFPLLMRLFPKSRFGQFCSAQALVVSLLGIVVAGSAAGLFIDGIGWLCRNLPHTANYVYRFNFLWAGFFNLVTAALGVWAYVYWRRLGGDSGYKPPAPWNPEGTEELEAIPTVGAQPGWVSLSLRLFDAIMWLSTLSLPMMIWWMHRQGNTVASHWYAVLVLPASAATWAGWKLLERGIRRDMARSLRREPLRHGVPHHGVLMIVSVQYLLSLLIWVAQVIVTVNLDMEWECILFGVGNVFNNVLLIASVLTIWLMEGGELCIASGGTAAQSGVRSAHSHRPRC